LPYRIRSDLYESTILCGSTIISLVSLLVKPSALKYSLTIDYKGFEIPNKFVIGYGLDYNGQARNLLDIYQLKE